MTDLVKVKNLPGTQPLEVISELNEDNHFQSFFCHRGVSSLQQRLLPVFSPVI